MNNMRTCSIRKNAALLIIMSVVLLRWFSDWSPNRSEGTERRTEAARNVANVPPRAISTKRVTVKNSDSSKEHDFPFPPSPNHAHKPSIDAGSTSAASYHFVGGRFSRDNRFAQMAADTREAAIKTGLFPPDNVHVYSELPDFILNDARFEQHRSFLSNDRSQSKQSERGAGFWFWKSLLIQKALSNMEDGDFLTYFDLDDCGLHFRLAPTILSKMQQRQADLALVQLPYMHRVWTKRDIYEKYCPGFDVEADPFLDKDAGLIFVRKTPASVQFFDKWVDAVSDYHLVSDQKSNVKNIYEFKENRHDQSLMNALLECGTPKPTQATIINVCDELGESIIRSEEHRRRFCHDYLGWYTYVLESNTTLSEE